MILIFMHNLMKSMEGMSTGIVVDRDNQKDKG